MLFLFDNWQVNPTDGAVINKDRVAVDFFSNPNTQPRKSSSEAEEATFFDDYSGKTKAKRNDINLDYSYQQAMGLGRTVARAKAFLDNGYVSPGAANDLVKNYISGQNVGDYPGFLIPTVAHRNFTGKLFPAEKIEAYSVPSETRSMRAKRYTNQSPSWESKDRFSFNAPKTVKQINWNKRPDITSKLLLSPTNDYGQKFARNLLEDENLDIGYLAAPEEMGHAQVGLGAFPYDNLASLGIDNNKLESMEKGILQGEKPEALLTKYASIDNYFTKNKIPSYAQIMAEGAVGLNSFRSDAGKYDTQLNYPEDYKAYFKFHDVFAPRSQFDETLKSVGTMRTNNWQKQMLQLRYIADEEFKRRFGRAPNDDEQLPDDILDGAIDEWNKRGLLRTAKNTRQTMFPERKIVV